MTLEGSRARVRAIEESDIPLTVRWRNDPEVYCGFVEYAPLSQRSQRAFVEGLASNGTRRLWMIDAIKGDVVPADGPFGSGRVGVPVGMIGLIDIDMRNRRCEMGPVFIGESGHRATGVALEAERMVVDHCFTHLGMHKVYAYVTESNASVIGFHERAGFRRDVSLREHIFKGGKFEDVIVLSIVTAEFERGESVVARGVAGRSQL